MDPTLVEIPGYPKYKLRPRDLQVISYYYKKKGHELARCRFRETMGFSLWANGKQKFFSEAQLKFITEKELKMQRGQFIVGSIHKTSGQFSTTASPATHSSHAMANMEAERLAKLSTDKRFVVLEVKGIVSVAAVNWE